MNLSEFKQKSVKKVKWFLDVLFSILITILFVISLSVKGMSLYVSLSLFIIATIAFMVIKRNSIFRPNLSKILLFLMLSIIPSFYIIKSSLYTEVSMSSFDNDKEIKEEERYFCPPLSCANSCHHIVVLEDGKEKCKVCYSHSINLKDNEYRCKSVIPLAVTACLVFSYLVSSLTICFISKYKKREVKK